MKYLLFIVILAAGVIAAGCVGGDKGPGVTATPTPLMGNTTLPGTPVPLPSSSAEDFQKANALYSQSVDLANAGNYGKALQTD